MEGVALPVLLGIAVGVGLLVAGIGLGIKLGTTSRRARNLGRQVAALQEELDYNRRTAKESRTGKPTPALSSAAPAVASVPDSSQFDDLI